MRKFIILCALLIPAVALAADDAGITIPDWSDFAPKTFVDVKAPKGISKFNVTAKYWYNRRVAFEEGIDKCRTLENIDEKFNCYEALKVEQYKLNSDYNARLEARENTTTAIPEMSSKSDQLLPINSYLNGMTKFIPNELGY